MIVYYETIRNRLPMLIKCLGEISTQHPFERKHIGEAMAYLNLLHDLLKDEETK